MGANGAIKEATGVELVAHPEEAVNLGGGGVKSSMFGFEAPPSPPADRLIREGDNLEIGNLKARIVELRGHSPCGIALLFEDEKVAIVGDALFAGSIGRTDFPGGSFENLTSDIRHKLFVLPDETQVFPGHGPATTIGREKRFNPFF
ncbi:MAG: MBL fold metallo-hydrolase [Deltaproteobacteria bacterium]|nr:MBL fold metallo-hydrolase [Deltaproteobacteria bacterium]